MRLINEFEDTLKMRYSRLYGKDICLDRIKRERHRMYVKAMVAVMLFAIAAGNSIVTANNEYSNVVLNDKGEITGIVRPEAEDGSYSFTSRVKIISDEGEREKEYYITIEPAGDNVPATGTQIQEDIPEEELADSELKRLISNLNKDTSERNVILPDSLENGDALVWMKAENTDPVLYFIGLIAALYMIYRNRFYEISKEEKAAKESIIKELPEFINKLVLLINAGVILNTAFLKIVDDCDDKMPDSSYFYRRMSDIGHMVRETNASFHQEMYSFAKNSGVKELMRITNILMDNISKGDDLSDKLKRENELLWFARKQQAEEKGKLAETKLTLPLMLLLSVLIIVTIAPALMEI